MLITFISTPSTYQLYMVIGKYLVTNMHSNETAVDELKYKGTEL